MKKFQAWLLLIISTAQWIGGFVCVEVVHFLEIGREMNASEQVISETILAETGHDATVNILPEGQRVRWGADYANYFTYEKSDSNGTVFYTIDYAPKTVTLAQMADQVPGENQDEAPASALLKLLLSKFLYEQEFLPQNIADDASQLVFRLDVLTGRHFSLPDSPPPDLI